MRRVAVTRADIGADQQFSVELVQTIEAPPVILLCWPGAPSITDARKFGAVAAAITAILAEGQGGAGDDQAG